MKRDVQEYYDLAATNVAAADDAVMTTLKSEPHIYRSTISILTFLNIKSFASFQSNTLLYVFLYWMQRVCLT